MKKRPMILFIILIVLLCVSFCLLSSTYAKYYTNSSSHDEGRVAIWGVDVNVNSDTLFDTNYKTTSDTVIVSSSSTAGIIAPGTSGSTSIIITGSPEVSSIFNLEFNTISDVFIKNGQYLDLSTDDPDKQNDEFLLASDYYPIVYTLTVKEKDNPEFIIAEGTLKYLEAEFNNYYEENYETRIFTPGEVLDTTFTISWTWASNLNNQADSWLGITSGGVIDPSLVVNTDYSVIANYEFFLSVIQVY